MAARRQLRVRTVLCRSASRWSRKAATSSPDLARFLLKAFAEPAPVMAGAAAVGDLMAVLPALFHLMWQHALVADLAVRLTAETLVVAGAAAGGAR
jgi:hypothetical protein